MITILADRKDSETWQKKLQQVLPDEDIYLFEETKEALKAEFLLCWKPKPGQLEAFKGLKVIQSLGAGVDHIFDTNPVPKGAKVCRIVDTQLTKDMWEYVLAAVLYCIKDFHLYTQQQKDRTWKPAQYATIPSTQIAVLGLGEIGAFVAKRLAATGFKVRGWSNSKKEIEAVQTFAGPPEFSSCLADTRVLVNLLPLTEATRNILNRKNLCCLPKGAFLINPGRGGHLVENDLLLLLEEGQLSGAFLDVFHTEPLPAGHPFWSHPRIFITPHVASLTNKNSALDQVVQNYQNMKKGLPLLNEVSVAKGY